MTPAELRAAAQYHFDEGCRGVIRAFNLPASAPDPWRFAPHVEQRAGQLLMALMTLFAESDVEPLPVQCAAANDPVFQHFLRSAGINKQAGRDAR